MSLTLMPLRAHGERSLRMRASRSGCRSQASAVEEGGKKGAAAADAEATEVGAATVVNSLLKPAPDDRA